MASQMKLFYDITNEIHLDINVLSSHGIFGSLSNELCFDNH